MMRHLNFESSTPYLFMIYVCITSIFFESFLFSTTFSFIEYFWYTITIENERGEIFIRPFDEKCRKGFTSFEQWWVNILCVPILLIYHYFIDYFLVTNYIVLFLECLCAPIIVWFVEIIEGKILRKCYGANNAWNYVGKNTYFDGDVRITLKQYFIWKLMYIFYYCFLYFITTDEYF